MSKTNEIKSLKDKLANLELEFSAKLEEAERNEKEEERKALRLKMSDNIISKKDPVIQINVGGTLFKCSSSILRSLKGSIFEEIYKNDESLKEIYFVDRNPFYFNTLLNYIRSKIFNPKDYDRDELLEIKQECDYYALIEMANIVDDILSKVEFVSMDCAPKYSNCGNHKLEDLKDKDLTTGVCVQSTYYITIELNFDHEFEKIEIGGFTGNNGSWAPSNGQGAKIATSIDKNNWKDVGDIPNNFGSTIITVPLKKSIARYIRFKHTSYLGLGYLKIIK